MSAELREWLRDDPLPGEAEAAARSWPVVEAALVEREAARSGARRGRARRRTAAPHRRAALRLALVAGLLAVGLAAALSPAGAWIEDRLRDEPERTAPAFTALPPGGSALAISRSGAYVVRPDGWRRLGSFRDAGWSPRGLHVVGVNGRRLVAVTAAGGPRWTITRPGRVHHPAWSLGDGFMVAYLEGAALRVVAGNGDPATDHRLRAGAAPVTPAWLPSAPYRLTYARAGGALETVDAATGEGVWRARVPGARELAWSRDGRTLAVLADRELTVLDRSGRVLRTLPLPARARDLALHPSGRRAAVTVEARGRMRVLSVPLDGAKPSQLFQGDVDGIAWSRDGRRLLVAWRGADQWLLLGPGERVRALDGVSRELGAAGGFPRLAGWCCPG